MQTQAASPAPSPMGTEEMALWRALRASGDVTARARLMELHLPYARVVAATYYARRTHDEVEFADYLQLARVGLVESVDRFDPDQGAQFRTFAARRMHGSILNGLERSTEKSQQIAVRKRVQKERLLAVKSAARESSKAHSRDSQDELFQYLAEVGVGLALGVLLEGSGMIDSEAFGAAPVASTEATYFQQTELQRLQKLVQDAVAQLSPQEQVVIRRHYQQDHPFEQIATHLKLSKGRISQIHKAALQRMRDALAQRPHFDIHL